MAAGATIGLLIHACAAGGAGSGDDSGTSLTGTGGTSTSSSGAGGGGHAGEGTSGDGGSTAGGAGGSGGDGGGGGAPCAEQPCKLTLPQCGCAGGEQCTIDNDGERLCAPDGTLGTGEACNGPCKAGNLCLTSGKLSVCKKFCDVDADCQPPGGLCALEVSDGKGGTLPAKWCSENCDLVTSTGCIAAGAKCGLGQQQQPPGAFFTVCIKAGTKTQGQACATDDECAGGYGCLNDGTKDLCVKWCQIKSPSCPGATQCVSLQTPLMIGTVEYGACI